MLLHQETQPQEEHIKRWRGLLQELKKEFRGSGTAIPDVSTQAADATLVSNQRPYDIVVVDDDHDICRSLQIVLGQEGMAARTASTKAEALRQLSKAFRME